MDEVPRKPLHACSPFRGITLNSPTRHTGCSISVRLACPTGVCRVESGCKDSPELRVVGIHFNPAPDAQDRLRRIFTILLEHAAGDRQAAPEDAPADAPTDDLAKAES